MHARVSCALAAFAAALLLTLAVGSASAGRLRATNRNISMTWETMNFWFEETGQVRAECAVTMEGSFHASTWTKLANTLIGHIFRARVHEAGCRGSRAVFLAGTLPWAITYGGFAGTLPNITHLNVRVADVAYEVREGFQTCLFREARPIPAVFRIDARGQMLWLEFGGAFLPAAGGFCFVSGGGMSNGGLITLRGGTNRITLTLI